MSIPTPSHPPRASVQINLSDGPSCEIWIRKIAEAVTAETRFLEVVFVSGGPKIEPSALLSLRNALLRIPDSVFVSTVATTSLSPFACVAWLVGDERWIAADAYVWIPQLPEPLLRGHSSKSRNGTEQSPLTRLPEAPASEAGSDGFCEDFESVLQTMSGFPAPFEERHQAGSAEEECGCRHCRQVLELRTLSSTVNEWFPSWEYAGAGLDVATLLELRIIRPEWVFGGKTSRRNAARHVESPASEAHGAHEAHEAAASAACNAAKSDGPSQAIAPSTAGEPPPERGASPAPPPSPQTGPTG